MSEDPFTKGKKKGDGETNDLASLEPPSAVTTAASSQNKKKTTQFDDENAKKKASVIKKEPVAAVEPASHAVASTTYSNIPHHHGAAGRVATTTTFEEKKQWGRDTAASAAPAAASSNATSGTHTEINASQVSSSHATHNNMPEKIRSRPTDALGPRVVAVPGPGLPSHERRPYASNEFSDDEGLAEAEVNTAAGPPDPAFVVPMAELVTENSYKLVQATEEDTTCYGRLGRRGCILLIGAQVIVVIVVVAVVVALVGGGGDEVSPTVAPSLVPSPAPSSQPTFNLTNAPSASPSVFPSSAPSIFPEPEECEFILGYIDPVVPRPYRAPVCQSQPSTVDLVFIGGNCSSQPISCFSYDSTTLCQDFPENGQVPSSASDTIVLIMSGEVTTLSPGDIFTLQNDGNNLPQTNSFEIHRNIPPPYNDTTILQRVEFDISCADQILCFTALGAMSIIS